MELFLIQEYDTSISLCITPLWYYYILFMLHLYYSPTYPVGPANECLQKIRRTGYVVFVLE